VLAVDSQVKNALKKILSGRIAHAFQFQNWFGVEDPTYPHSLARYFFKIFYKPLAILKVNLSLPIFPICLIGLMVKT
jgi:hypothetical protein